MDNKIKGRIKLALKIIFVIAIFVLIVTEFTKLFKTFDFRTFNMYKDQLTISNLIVIGILGVTSYIPLSMYDFVLKGVCNIKLQNRRLYKYSWIASSIASIVGFGGASAIALKGHFYSPHIEEANKKTLVKEVTKIVALNFTGFSMVCFLYTLFNIWHVKDYNIIQYGMIVMSLYTPSLVIYNIYRYIKNEKRVEAINTLKIMGISVIEWITSVILIYGIIRILGTKLTLMNIFPIYVTSCAIGILSMIPGGLGTFDLTFIMGLSKFGVPQEQALLALVLYRVSYYIVPVLIGIVLAIHEGKTVIDKKYNNIFSSILSQISYNISAILIFLSGIMILLFRALPEMRATFRGIYKLIEPSSNISITTEIIMGFLLIAISRMLAYKAKDIFTIVMILLAIALGSSFIDKSMGQIIFLIFVIAFLWLSKKNFYRESFCFSWERILQDTVFLFGFLLFYLIIYFPRFPMKAKRLSAYVAELLEYNYNYLLLSSLLGFLLSIGFIAIVYLIAKSKKYPFERFKDNKEAIDNILENYKGSPLTHLMYLEDKYVFLNKEKNVLIQYQKYADKLIALGNPIGEKHDFISAIEEFYQLADKYGYTPIFYQVDIEMIPTLHEYGYQFMKLGEEGIVDLTNFSIAGKKTRGLRAGYNKIAKAGYTFEVVNPKFSKELIEELKEISDEWLNGKSEKGFSMGFFDEDYLNLDTLFIVRDENSKIKCFANMMPMYDNKRSLSIDLMRYSNDSLVGIMDFMFLNIIEYGKANGYKNFNIGMAPLSNVGTSKFSFVSERIAAQLSVYGQNFYSFVGIRNFKEKYTKQWIPKYLAYRRNSSLPFTMLQVILVCNRKLNDNR